MPRVSVSPTTTASRRPVAPTPTYTHNPYGWKALPDSESEEIQIFAQRVHAACQRSIVRSSPQPQPQPHHVGVPIAAGARVPTADALDASISFSRDASPCAYTDEEASPVPPASGMQSPVALLPEIEAVAPAEPVRPVSPVATEAKTTRSNRSSRPQHATVRFTCIRRVCQFNPSAFSPPLAAGATVIVEGDRGLDAGVVEEIVDSSKASPNAKTIHIQRHATRAELAVFNERLPKSCREAKIQVSEVLANTANFQGVKVLKSVFQFDFNKLTIFYTSPRATQFKTVLPTLHRKFGCRIWLTRCTEEGVKKGMITPHPTQV